MQDEISAPKVGGIVRLTRFILKGTLLIEAAGAMLLLPVFYGITKEREFGCQSFILFPLFFVMQALIFWEHLQILFLP